VRFENSEINPTGAIIGAIETPALERVVHQHSLIGSLFADKVDLTNAYNHLSQRMVRVPLECRTTAMAVAK